MSAPFLLDPSRADAPFPPVDLALRQPNGLLAIGGNLAPERIVNAYRAGVFPWYSADQPILWWSPDPRSVLFPQHLRVSRSLRKTMRQERFLITMDRAFDQVIGHCAMAERPGQDGTWIVSNMVEAYRRLHNMGFAHSVEAWQSGTLVGGLYGIAIGRVFFGESMFSKVSDASKVAFVQFVGALEQWGYQLIDCQIETDHLNRFGAQNVPRREFVALLQRWCREPPAADSWQMPHVQRSHSGVNP